MSRTTTESKNDCPTTLGPMRSDLEPELALVERTATESADATRSALTHTFERLVKLSASLG